jgi:hypothetical protein
MIGAVIGNTTRRIHRTQRGTLRVRESSEASAVALAWCRLCVRAGSEAHDRIAAAMRQQRGAVLFSGSAWESVSRPDGTGAVPACGVPWQGRAARRAPIFRDGDPAKRQAKPMPDPPHPARTAGKPFNGRLRGAAAIGVAPTSSARVLRAPARSCAARPHGNHYTRRAPGLPE